MLQMTIENLFLANVIENWPGNTTEMQNLRQLEIQSTGFRMKVEVTPSALSLPLDLNVLSVRQNCVLLQELKIWSVPKLEKKVLST